MRGWFWSGLVAFVGLAGLVLAARGHGSAASVPVLEIRRAHFLHQVVAEGNLKEATSTPLSVPITAQEGMKVAWLLPDGSRVKAGDVVVRFDPTEIEKRLADGLSDRATAAGKAAKLGAEGGSQLKNLDRDRELAGEELEAARRFQTRDPDIYSKSQIVEAEIDENLASAKQEHATTARSQRERLARSDLDLVAIERRKADLKVEQARTLQGSLEVRAPHDGIVLLERNWRGEPVREGEQCWPGQAVARIPRLEVMQAEVFVLEEDAGGIAAGAAATVRIEAHPETLYQAKVKQIDKMAKPRVRNSPIQYFGVVLELDRTDPAVMKTGQRVQAVVQVAEKDAALAVPHQAVFEREGKKVVYRRRGSGFEPAEVTLGVAGLARVVIEKGLEDGDFVALQDPTRSRTPPKGRS